MTYDYPANTAISGKVREYKALLCKLVHFQKITNSELIKKEGQWIKKTVTSSTHHVDRKILVAHDRNFIHKSLKDFFQSEELKKMY